MANTSQNSLPIGHELTEGAAHHALTVYGTATCEDTNRARALLDSLNVPYNYYDIELDDAMARTAAALQNGGEKTPVIDFHDGAVLIEPSNDELMSALQKSDRLPHSVSATV